MTKAGSPLLGGLSPQQFLSEYWQKKPLLVRNAFPDFISPVEPEDLAGLSLEENVESRVIIESLGDKHWVLERGPFEESKFQTLNGLKWTLLIQQLDAWSEEINALKSEFDFIPNWRIDDVMASYAPRGGSVGPHFDYYDVFLIQAHGERRWKLGQQCDDRSPLLCDTPLSILEHFDAQTEWVLEPGDMLYVPPKLAHYGVAENDCITLSVGFRAPRQLEMLNHFTDHQNAPGNMVFDPFYEDPDRLTPNHPGEISAQDKHKLKQMLKDLVTDEERFDRWIGVYLSEPKNKDTLIPDESLQEYDNVEFSSETLASLLANASQVVKNEGSRFMYSQTRDALLLFVDGEVFKLGEEHLTFVQMLSSESRFDAQNLLTICNTLPLARILYALIQQGSLVLEMEGE